MGDRKGILNCCTDGFVFFKKNKTMKINKNFLRVCTCVGVVLFSPLWGVIKSLSVTTSAVRSSGRIIKSTFLPLYSFSSPLPLVCLFFFQWEFGIYTRWGEGRVCDFPQLTQAYHMPKECLDVH